MLQKKHSILLSFFLSATSVVFAQEEIPNIPNPFSRVLGSIQYTNEDTKFLNEGGSSLIESHFIRFAAIQSLVEDPEIQKDTSTLKVLTQKRTEVIADVKKLFSEHSVVATVLTEKWLKNSRDAFTLQVAEIRKSGTTSSKLANGIWSSGKEAQLTLKLLECLGNEGLKPLQTVLVKLKARGIKDPAIDKFIKKMDQKDKPKEDGLEKASPEQTKPLPAIKNDPLRLYPEK